MSILKYLRLPFLFDIHLLQEEVVQLCATPWRLHYQKLHYEGDWSAIPLRSRDGNANDIFISPEEKTDYRDTIFLDSSPSLKAVLQTFQCPLRTVRLMKLNAGAIIKEHRDVELNFENGEIRLHVPIITNDDVEFYLDSERIPLKQGECWYLNFNLPHSVSNNSNIDRVHLVIDASVNDWVKTVFNDPGLSVKKEIDDPFVAVDDATKKKMILRFRDMNTETSNRLADELERELEG